MHESLLIKRTHSFIQYLAWHSTKWIFKKASNQVDLMPKAHSTVIINLSLAPISMHFRLWGIIHHIWLAGRRSCVFKVSAKKHRTDSFITFAWHLQHDFPFRNIWIENWIASDAPFCSIIPWEQRICINKWGIQACACMFWWCWLTACFFTR